MCRLFIIPADSVIQKVNKIQFMLQDASGHLSWSSKIFVTFYCE